MSQRRLTVILGLLSALGPLSIDLYLPSFPSIASSLGTSVPAVQLTLAAYVSGIALGQLVHGPLSDQFGRRPPLLAGLALYGAAAVACAASPNLLTLAAARFVQGIGGCAGIVVARAVVRDRCDEGDAATLYSSRMLVMGAAPILGPLLGGQILLVVGWRSIFVVLAFVAFALFALVALKLPESLPYRARRVRSARETLRASFGVLGNVPFLRLALAGGASEAAMFAYMAGSPFVFIEIFGVRAEHFGFIFGANALGLVAASQLNRWAVRRVGVRRALRAGVIAAVVSHGALVLTLRCGAPLAVVLAPVFLGIASLGVVMPNATAAAMDCFDEHAGCASAILGVLQSTLDALASMAVSALADGTARPMAAVMLTCGIAALGLLGVRPRRSPRVARRMRSRSARASSRSAGSCWVRCAADASSPRMPERRCL